MTNQIKAQPPEMASLSNMKTVTDQATIADIYALYLDDESHSFDGQTDKFRGPEPDSPALPFL